MSRTVTTRTSTLSHRAHVAPVQKAYIHSDPSTPAWDAVHPTFFPATHGHFG